MNGRCRIGIGLWQKQRLARSEQRNVHDMICEVFGTVRSVQLFENPAVDIPVELSELIGFVISSCHCLSPF